MALEFGKKEKGIIQEIPQTPSLPPELIRDTGIEVVEPATAANVKDGTQDLMVSPETQERRIEIPTSEQNIETLAKGSPDNSSTWLGKFMTMLRKKAARKGAAV